jgi:hypothetical protein
MVIIVLAAFSIPSFATIVIEPKFPVGEQGFFLDSYITGNASDGWNIEIDARAAVGGSSDDRQFTITVRATSANERINYIGS